MACNQDDEPISALPRNIVTLGTDLENSSPVLMNVNVQSEQVVTYDLFEDFGIVGFYNLLIDPEAGLVEFLYYDRSVEPRQTKLVTYQASNEQVMTSTINFDLERYSWAGAAGSNEYLALQAVPTDGTNGAVTIIDKGSGQATYLDICDECFWIVRFAPMLVRNNRLFTFYEDINTRRYHLVAVDLAAKEVLYTSELQSYPTIVVGEASLYQFIPSNRSIQVHDQSDFSVVDSYAFRFNLDLGFHPSENEQAVVFTAAAQPSPILTIPAIFDFSNGAVVSELDFQQLVSTNPQRFEEASGIQFNSTPSVVSMDLSSEFALYRYTTFSAESMMTDYGYLYSNRDSEYLDHIELPHPPTDFLLLK